MLNIKLKLDYLPFIKIIENVLELKVAEAIRLPLQYASST